MVSANGDESLDGRSVILHTGFPKTGTTSLQTALSTARPALLRHGVLYPRSAGDVSHRHLAAFAHGLDRNLVTHALLGIRSLIAVLPLVASAVVIVALHRYPLRGERYRRMRAALAGPRGPGPHTPDGA